jgi:uncharacterized SAM-dependent methyltransferase
MEHNNIFGKLLGSMEKEITRLDHKAYTGLSNVNQHKFLKNKKTLRNSRNPNDQQYLTTTYRTRPSEILVKNFNSSGGTTPPFNLNETSYN